MEDGQKELALLLHVFSAEADSIQKFFRGPNQLARYWASLLTPPMTQHPRIAAHASFLCLLLGIVLPLGEQLSPLFSFQATTCRS